MGIQVITSNAPTPTYKVFTGLLTQSGGYDPQFLVNIDNGNIVPGVTYNITNYQIGDDFTNVGAPSNANGVSFIANGTTALNWPGSTELNYNTGAPTCITLENTLGNVWFEYGGTGSYAIQSNNLFTYLKSTLIIGNCFGETGSGYVLTWLDETSNGIIKTVNFLNVGVSNEYLTNTPIEIRVYN